jgi:hypothetical protein
MSLPSHLPDPFVPVMGRERGVKRPPDPIARLDLVLAGLSTDYGLLPIPTTLITEMRTMSLALREAADDLQKLSANGWQISCAHTSGSDGATSVVVSSRKRFINSAEAETEARRLLTSDCTYVLGWDENPDHDGPDSEACAVWLTLS